MKIHWLSLIIACGIVSSTGLYASRDNAHFYRATNFIGEPRFEKPWLSTFDIYASYGSTSTGFNREHEKVPLLDIYGAYNMQLLGVDVPGKDFNNISDIILEELSLLPARKAFGHLSYDGKFSLTELNIFYLQNFAHGFFFQFHTPVRFMNITDISFCDLSPHDCQEPNQKNPIWLAFIDDFNNNNILNQYCLCAGDVKEHGIGDISLQLGWTLNYQETDVLDFLDLTIKSGFLFSSSKKQDPNVVFSIPLGYNGHSAVPLSFDAALGTYDWLTVGAHTGALFFFNTEQTLRMKTDQEQSGFIKLAEGHCVKTEKGTIWEASAYLKADHIVRGFSFLVGYSYVTEQSDELMSSNCAIFPTAIINSDDMFAGWNMHTIHARAEYDFTREHSWVGPRVTLFYDYPVSGKRIFRTGMVGGNVGVDFAWRLD